MGISISDPIGQAGSRVARMLFKPFNIGKWFTLGFAAFLAHLAEGGGGNLNFPRGFGGGGGGGGTGGATGGVGEPSVRDEVMQFLLTYGVWIALGVLGLLALWVLVLWIRARGKFVFLNGVARNDAAIIEPWKRLKAQADSYFRFDLLLVVLMFVGLAAIAGISYLIALPDINAQTMGRAGIASIVTGGVLLLLLLVIYGLASVIAEDFLIPLMYLRAQPIGAAWREFRARILPGNYGMITLFYLMRIVLGFGIAIIMIVGTCVTCCIAAIPYIGSVIFLPILIFNRSYSLYFLAQFGEEYNFMVDVEPRPVMGFPVVLNTSPLPPPDPPNEDQPNG